MTLFVLDTNVISELVKDKPEPGVIAFLNDCPESLVSAVVFHELAYGAERLRDNEKRMKLDLFIQGLKAVYQGRIVEVDVGLAELAGRLRARVAFGLGACANGCADRGDRGRQGCDAGHAQYRRFRKTGNPADRSLGRLR